jgi:hypothetical protein
MTVGILSFSWMVFGYGDTTLMTFEIHGYLHTIYDYVHIRLYALNVSLYALCLCLILPNIVYVAYVILLCAYMTVC